MRGLHVYILLAAAALALVFADQLSSYWMHVAIIAMFYAIVTASWAFLPVTRGSSRSATWLSCRSAAIHRACW